MDPSGGGGEYAPNACCSNTHDQRLATHEPRLDHRSRMPARNCVRKNALFRLFEVLALDNSSPFDRRKPRLSLAAEHAERQPRVLFEASNLEGVCFRRDKKLISLDRVANNGARRLPVQAQRRHHRPLALPNESIKIR